MPVPTNAGTRMTTGSVDSLRAGFSATRIHGSLSSMQCCIRNLYYAVGHSARRRPSIIGRYYNSKYLACAVTVHQFMTPAYEATCKDLVLARMPSCDPSRNKLR